MYKDIIFTWPIPDERAYEITVHGTDDAAAEFPSPTTFQVDISKPLYPYLAQDFENWLNSERGGTGGGFQVRWQTEEAEWGLEKSPDPRLAIRFWNNTLQGGPGYSDGDIIFTFSPSTSALDLSYEVDDWIGAKGGSLGLFINSSFTNSSNVLPGSPDSVWNPAVVSFRDVRNQTRSVASSMNAASLRKSVTVWAENYTREFSLIYVAARDVFPWFRADPAYEFDSNRRTMGGNLFTNLQRAAAADNDIIVLKSYPTEFGLNVETWTEAHTGRAIRVFDEIINSTEGAEDVNGTAKYWTVGINAVESVAPNYLTLGI